MSLIHVIVSLGIISIIIAGVSSALVYAGKETRYLEAKLSALELQRTLTGISPGINICAFALAKEPSKYKVPKNVFLNTKFNLSKLSFDLAGEQTIAESGSTVLGTPHLKIKEIQLENLFESSGKTIADLRIEYDSLRTLRPLINRILVETTADEDHIQITGCSSLISSTGSPASREDPQNQADCEVSGGSWFPGNSTRPAFCYFQNHTINWY